ncbi:AI-2E family transporter [Metapseudomonas otitidis]|uniref:AI-2E family transporter n=1 Tax=Metapseudomonas otitidis TaxID=319939 RepID=UPI0013F65AA3|nr:AI-2E family transporter [Pseudomonas otitidis]
MSTSRYPLELRSLILLLVLVSLAFIWILLPFYGAAFWAVVLTAVFASLQRRLALRLGGRGNLSALLTLGVCLLVAIIPVCLIGLLLVQQGADLYSRLESGELDLGMYLERFIDLLPQALQQHLGRFGLDNLNDLRDRLVSAATQGSQFLATQAFSIGQDTFQVVISFFLMLYLLFFFLRDGPEIVRHIRTALPLADHHKRRLQLKFTRVVRATVKGNVVVAVIQGGLGGVVFWLLGIPSALLWGVLMAFLSLLPAVGSGLIWAPVAAWLMLSGELWQGAVLVLAGVLVIGMVDNLLRPILVGKDTRMPDYLVLLSTLGGISLFGLNGFVIGPLVAALFMASWGLYVSTRRRVRLP